MGRRPRAREEAKRVVLRILTAYGSRPVTLQMIQEEASLSYSTLKRAARELESSGLIRAVSLTTPRGRPPEAYLVTRGRE